MLLFFSIIFCIIILIIILIRFSEIKIIIKEFELTSDKKIEPVINFKICFCFAKKITWACIKINNKNKRKKILNRIISKNNIDKIKNIKYRNNKPQKVIKEICKLIKDNLIINKLKFQMYIDTENEILTSILVGIISSIIPNIIKENMKNVKKENLNFIILPLYKNHNYFYIHLNCIISIKFVHIINMLKTIGGIQNERTSNRRLNVNCYGKY